MYFLLKRSLKLKLAKNPNSQAIELSPVDINYKDIFRLLDEKVATGLTAPYPESLLVIHNNNHNSSSGFLISKDQLSENFIKLEQVQKGDKLTLLHNSCGHDNSFNSPEKVKIPKGTTLIANQSQGTNRGDYFFDYKGVNVDLNDLYSPHPYALPVIMPDVFVIERNGTILT